MNVNKARTPLTQEQIDSVREGLLNWAWENPTNLLAGVNITTAPASESSEHRNGVIRVVEVLDANGMLKHHNFLLSLRAGWSKDGQCPQDLLDAVGTESYLALKNRYQITLTINPTIASSLAVLKQLVPNWETMRKDAKITIAPDTMKVIGVRFAAGREGGLAQTTKGGFIYNFDGVEIIERASLYAEGASITRGAVGNRIDHEKANAQLGGGLVFGAKPATAPAQVTNPATAGEPVVAGRIEPKAQPDAAIVAQLSSMPDALKAYMAQFQ